MLHRRVLVLLCAGVYLGLGLAFLFRPDAMAEIVGIELTRPAARIDFRATYGGFELGTAAFLFLCASRDEWIRPGLWAVFLTLSGFFLTRTGSLLAERSADPLLVATAAAELGAVIWSGLLLRRPPA